MFLNKAFEDYKFLYFLFSWAISIGVYGQKNFNQLSVNEGLSHSDVTTITQDKSGIIWMGTNNGLNRFDGYEFKIYKSDLNNKYSIPNNRIKSLLTDSKNRLWIATESKQLSYFQPKLKKFFTIPIGDDSYTGYSTKLVKDSSGKIWFSTSKNEIYRVEKIKGKFRTIKAGSSLKSEVISMICFNSYVWVSTRKNGLLRIDCKSNKVEPFQYPIFHQTFSLFKKDGELYVSTPRGIFSIDKNFKIKQLYKANLQEVSDIQVDFRKNIWLGFYNNGMQLLEKTVSGNYELKKSYSSTNSLSTNRINDLYIDSFDLLWIGTSGGGAQSIDLRANPFHLINKKNSVLPDNYITSIVGTKDHLWIGSRNGLIEYNLHNEESHLITDGHISSLYIDSKGKLWVGKRFGGIWIYENNKLINLITKQTNKDFPSNEIMGMGEDEFGRFWIITYDQGAVIFDKKQQISGFLNTSNFLPSNRLCYLYLDRKNSNTAWVGTVDHGLLKIDFNDSEISSVKDYEFDVNDKNSISSNFVWPILRSSTGDLWVGTLGGGLNKLVQKNGKVYFKRYTINDGLPDNDVESMLEDSMGNIWIGGRGLTKFNPKKENFVRFDFNDGLQSNSFKIGSAFKSQEGILYFGGINGLNYFNPRLINNNPYKPKLVFEELQLWNKSVNVGEKIHDRILLKKSLNNTDILNFNHNENEFSIELLGVHYSNPKKNSYAYILEGYNNEWINVDSEDRKISFSNLSPGKYILKAKVSNRDGLWSDPKSIMINISPPWWATWWAKFLYLLLFIGALYFYRIFINRQSSLKNNLVIAEKEMSLTSEKIRFFTNISHEIRTPLTLIKSHLEDIVEAESLQSKYESKLDVMQNNVNRLLNLTNLLLDFRKMESGNLKLKAARGNFSNFSKEIFSFFLGVADKKNIQYNFYSFPENICLTFDRNNFEIIITNLISNAFKYTKSGGAISMELKAVGDDNKAGIFQKISNKKILVDNYLQVKIEDNGIGMSKKDLKKIFDRYYQVKNQNTFSIQGTGIGLSLVKGLVELHKGEIEVESSENKGSKFVLKIPFGQNHLKEKFLIKDFKKSDHSSFYVDDLYPKPAISGIETNDKSIKKRILIVEDNFEIRSFLNEHLKEMFNVLQANDGKAGLAKAKKYIPDIIVSDVMMPGMDGLEMLKRLKEDPDLSYIPVILLTARTANLYEFKGIDIGAQDYITKPFSIRILKGKINNILRAREDYKQYYKDRIQNLTSSINLPNSEQKFLDDISNIVLENITNEEFSVKMLVQKMGMSQSSCYKRIKELTGRSAVQLIRDVRLKRAGELLAEDRYNISEIAFMVGINDIQYFRKKFKEHFGCNPSELKTEV